MKEIAGNKFRSPLMKTDTPDCPPNCCVNCNISFSNLYIFQREENSTKCRCDNIAYTYFEKRCRRERRMSAVERKLHDRKELWFPYLVGKKTEFFAWRKTDTIIRAAKWLRLNTTAHQKFGNIAFHCHKRLRKMKPLPLNSEEYGQTIWLAIEGQHYMKPASWKIIFY